MLESDLIGALTESFESRAGVREVVREPRVGARLRPDLLIVSDGVDLVIEVKATPPQTRLRLREMIQQLNEYREALLSTAQVEVRFIVVVPSALAPPYRALIEEAGLELWDASTLIEMLSQSDGPYSSRVRAVLLEERAEGSSEWEPRPSRSALLASALGELTCGKPTWSRYQRTCADILEHLFCPPLERPLYESANETKTNRRDIVLPNYSSEGFWKFMRDEYRAHHVVVDAKNYCNKITKTSVLQLANYLNDHGAGLFGLILIRSGEAASASITRREQWIVHRKMIVVLDDVDLGQMLTNKDTGLSPETVIRQKIEDFRLSF